MYLHLMQFSTTTYVIASSLVPSRAAPGGQPRSSFGPESLGPALYIGISELEKQTRPQSINFIAPLVSSTFVPSLQQGLEIEQLGEGRIKIDARFALIAASRPRGFGASLVGLCLG
jgi:hypothetical protein